MKVECAWCGKELERIPSRAKGRNYCNAKHQMAYEYGCGIRDRFETTKKAREVHEAKTREKFKTNPTMKIGKRGYRLIYIPQEGWKIYSHYIWEQNYGEIPKGYAIHHINFNKLDDRIENLQMLPINEHHKLHDRMRKRNKKSQYIPFI